MGRWVSVSGNTHCLCHLTLTLSPSSVSPSLTFHLIFADITLPESRTPVPGPILPSIILWVSASVANSTFAWSFQNPVGYLRQLQTATDAGPGENSCTHKIFWLHLIKDERKGSSDIGFHCYQCSIYLPFYSCSWVTESALESTSRKRPSFLPPLMMAR